VRLDAQVVLVPRQAMVRGDVWNAGGHTVGPFCNTCMSRISLNQAYCM
jgi:hypothetical protein